MDAIPKQTLRTRKSVLLRGESKMWGGTSEGMQYAKKNFILGCLDGCHPYDRISMPSGLTLPEHFPFVLNENDDNE